MNYRFGNWVKVHVIVLVKRTKERKRPLPVNATDSSRKNGSVPDGQMGCGMTLEENGHITPTTKPGPPLPPLTNCELADMSMYPVL